MDYHTTFTATSSLMPHPPIAQEQLHFWEQNGYLVLPKYFSQQEHTQFTSWIEDVANWPETKGKWMRYYETSTTHPHQSLLARIENFLPYHEGLKDLLLRRDLLQILSLFFKEQAVLFKEKINFKLPGGGGFKAHQDAPAFVSFQQTFHITMMIPIDPMTSYNGPLEVVPHYRPTELLRQEPDGTLAKDIEQSHSWIPLLLEPGDVVFFDSYMLHRSQDNHSLSPRRALYVTYNGNSQGSKRDHYFQLKRQCFPPVYERLEGVDYNQKGSIFNLGNPIK